MRERTSPERDSERGMVLLETALAIPVLVAVAIALVWVVSLGAAYVRVLDTAQTAARQVARGAQATTGHEGVVVEVATSGGMVEARAHQEVATPVTILWPGASVAVEASAVAAIEPATP